MTRFKLLLVILGMTSSIASALAADTLKVTSQRIIDMCGQEQRWLIVADLGEIYVSDSLLSFDIILGYDAARMRPTTGLKSGTLSEQLDLFDSPYFNFVTKGEIWVSAAGLTRPARGKLPLFAVAGDYIGTCNQSTNVTVAFAPEFNEEFKRKVEVYRTDSVVSVAIPKNRPDLGAFPTVQALQMEGKDSTAEGEIVLRCKGMRDSLLSLELAMSRPDAFEIVSVWSDDVNVKDLVLSGNQRDTSGVMLKVNALADSVTIRYSVRSLTDSRDTTETLSVHMTSSLECGCIRPTGSAAIALHSRKQDTTTVDTDVDEATDYIVLKDGTIIVQCLHRQPESITVYSLLGEVVAQVTNIRENRIQIPVQSAPSGPLFVQMVRRGLPSVKMVLK